MDPRVTDRSSLLWSDDPYVYHNSGTLQFGPGGYIYISIGDGSLAGDPYENAQDISSFYGKIHRWQVVAADQVPEGAEIALLEEPGEAEATPAPEGEEAVGTPDA
jgi:glucose/arabinose dehydrogenase